METDSAAPEPEKKKRKPSSLSATQYQRCGELLWASLPGVMLARASASRMVAQNTAGRRRQKSVPYRFACVCNWR